jgi:heme b synthase
LPRCTNSNAGTGSALRIVAWELTRRCYLNCKHCRAAAQDTEYEGELSTEECRRVVDVIAERASPLMILTGGEPMCRDDVYEIAAYCTGKGLRTVMAPCGWLIDDAAAKRLLDAGIRKISISLDGPDAASHDAFRGREGAFDKSVAGLEAARRAGIAFQINTTITARNQDRLDEIYDLAVRLGADLFNPFMLVPSGRGKALADEAVSPETYERILVWMVEKQEKGPIPLRPTCAPHYQRVRRQMDRKDRAGAPGGASRPAPSGHGGDGPPLGGCLGGRHFLFISHTGVLQICGFLDLPCGDLREAGFDLWKLWDTAPVFLDVRDPDRYKGKCGACEYLRVCHGCRARAHAFTGDYMAEEPFCSWIPKKMRDDD